MISSSTGGAAWRARALRVLPPAARNDADGIRRRSDRLAALLAALGEDTGDVAPPATTDARTLDVQRLRLARLHASAVARLSRVSAVQAAFARHLRLFESVEIAVASFDSRDAAGRALDDAARHGAGLASDVPAEPVPLVSLPTHGYVGMAMRGDLPVTLAEAAFARGAARIVGPVRHAGRYWLVERLMPPTAIMNDGTYTWCEDLLVDDALEAQATPR